MANDRQEQFGKWITRKFLDLQSESGHAWTVTEFAEYLECPQQSASRWMSGKSLPDEARINRLAEKLGDDIYEVTGYPRPDPDLHYISSNWSRASAKLRKSVRSLFERGLDE